MVSIAVKQSITARYEFRIFGDDCRAIGERVAQMATQQGEEQRTDTYILATSVDNQNCKIREGHLEMKSLLGEDAGLEQWQPMLDELFPVRATWLRDEFFPVLDHMVPPLLREGYTVRQFLDEVIAPHPTLNSLLVFKHRRLFALDECRIEVGTVHITQKLPIYTVALEAQQVPLVQETRTMLGLQNYANTNYVEMLKGLL